MANPRDAFPKMRKPDKNGWGSFTYGAVVAIVLGLIAGSWLAFWSN